eukprot:783193-Ditylum_brightwellii.AAC.1
MSRTNMLNQNIARIDVKEEDAENEKEVAFSEFGALTETSGTFLSPIDSALEISEATNVLPLLTNIEKEEEEEEN